MSSHFETYNANLKRYYAARQIYVYMREQDRLIKHTALGWNPWTNRPFQIAIERSRCGREFFPRNLSVFP